MSEPVAPEVPRNAATALATALLDELVRGGVRDLVLAPGSRSAPLAFAAHAAHAAGRLRLHVRLDERTAGFLALGLARGAGRPAAVVTTSGTAPAHLHPAVLEAHHAGVGLVICSADRPAHLRGTGANQTTHQAGLFGAAVRAAADVPAPYPGSTAAQGQQVAGWRSLAARLVATASGADVGRPGPVHLNLQLAEPLVPAVDDGWSHPVDGRDGDVPWTSVQPRPRAVDPLRLAQGPRTVVVAGDDAGPPARVLAERAGWPLLAEPTSGSRTGDAVVRTYRLLLATELGEQVERVVVAGHPTLSRPVTRLVGRADVEVLALADHLDRAPWTDPGHRAAQVAWALEADEPDAAARDWRRRWAEADAELSGRLDDLLASWPGLAPHLVAGAVSRALPPGGLLVVGASNPVRDLDLMVARYEVGDRRKVVANRGLAGIDGTVSTAVGAALARRRTTRALALMGDVTFLHDAAGLVTGRGQPVPDLTLVVVNDDGGSIFAGLETGEPAYAERYDVLFGTPHGVDVAALCAATGTPHRRVTEVGELDAVLATPRGPGLEVVEAVVDRSRRRELDSAIRALATG